MRTSHSLAPAKFTTVRTDLKLDKVKIDPATGDFSARALAEVVDVKDLNEVVVQAWLERAGEFIAAAEVHLSLSVSTEYLASIE